MADLLQTLVRLGEKAANLARIIRAERSLFELLVEEKTGEAKNKRFVQDFKTLGDVLIQEMIRHDVGVQFPGLADYVYGEESNKFTNTNGESIEVAVQATAEQTKELLTKVLDGNMVAAQLLAQAVHQEMSSSLDPKLASVTFDLDLDSVGIWIDPIDSTAEYIKGIDGECPENGVYQHGLQCSVVIIGAFDREMGSPLMGVVNQPFAKLDPSTNSWTGQCFWGVSCGDFKCNSLTPSVSTTPDADSGLSLTMSSSEDEAIKSALSSLTNGRIHFASGAGYKILCVVEGHVDAYILTKGSTFKWDTCGPHAILQSLGGGIIDCRKGCSSINGSFSEELELKYNKPDVAEVSEGQTWANHGGIIAYRNWDTVLKLLKAIPK